MTFNGLNYHADYTNFKMGPESDNYRISIDGYSGDAGDDMSYHNNMQFSTKDRDHDKEGNQHCAQGFTGGWWYKKCHNVHPTGIWGSKDRAKGINWYSITTHTDSLSSITMKVTPTN